MNRTIQINEIAILNRETYKKDELPEIIYYLDTGNLNKNNIEYLQELKTAINKIPSRAQRKVRNNTILYSTVRPNQEHHGIIEKEIKDLIVSTGFTTIDVTDEEVCPKYLYYLLIQNHLINYLHSIAQNSVSSYPSISPNDLGTLTFKIPELYSQKQIAKVLSDLDAKIEVNNQINAKLEAMAKTLYEYWFVQFDFPSPPTPEGGEKEGKPYKSSGGKMVHNEELKREIPEGWGVNSLGDVLDFQRGISYRSSEIKDKEGVPLINLNSFNLDGRYKNKGLKKYSGKYNKSKIVKPNDLIIAITDVTRNADIIGKSFFVPEIFNESDLLISCDTAKVVVDNQDLLYFLNFFFNSKPYHEYIKHFASGTLVLHLNLKGVEWCKIALPDDKLLFQFANKIKPILKRIDNTILENQKLAELRDWLLPMLMNGQITINETKEYVSGDHGELGMVAESREKYDKI